MFSFQFLLQSKLFAHTFIPFWPPLNLPLGLLAPPLPYDPIPARHLACLLAA